MDRNTGKVVVIAGIAGVAGAAAATAWWFSRCFPGSATEVVRKVVPDVATDVTTDITTGVVTTEHDTHNLASCTGILFVGGNGVGRSRAIRTIRPWLAKFNYPSRHLTIANVIGEGYVHGAFSDDDWHAAVAKYEAALAEDELAYTKAVLRAVQERDTHPTVMLVSNITTAAEVAHLASVLKDVIVVHIVSDSAAATALTAVPALDTTTPDLTFVGDVGDDGVDSAGTYTSKLARAFAGTLLPRLNSKLTIQEIATILSAHTIPIPNTLGAKFYDTASLWVVPGVLHSLMFISAAQLTLKGWEFNAVTAVGPNAIPLATLLAHMLRKKHLLLLHHTKMHDTHTETAWETGTSALGPFAIGWSTSLTASGPQRVLLVDDILATGCRARAAAALARRVGCDPVGMCVLLDVPVARAELGVPLHVLMEK